MNIRSGMCADALKGYVEGNIYHRNDFFLQPSFRARRPSARTCSNSLALQNLPARIIEVFAVLGLFVLGTDRQIQRQ